MLNSILTSIMTNVPCSLIWKRRCGAVIAAHRVVRYSVCAAVGTVKIYSATKGMDSANMVERAHTHQTQ